MRIFFIICFSLFLYGIGYTQSDINNAGSVFSISYSDIFNKQNTENDVSILKLTKDSISFEISFIGFPGSKTITIENSKLSNFGYKTGIGFGKSIRNGALFGFAVGFIGALASVKSIDFGNGILVGLILSVPGALIGALTGIGSKEYEIVDVSKYDMEQKYEIINRLIQKGTKKNK
ncbi:hypothetical protein BH10BAC5_BH10BAC5_18380 [soil metagenome]